MSGKAPHAAFCEEYDEDSNEIRPDTRRVANIKKTAEPLVDGASDSGYSSRTAATVNSTQSGPSGRKSPVPLKLDTAALKRADLERVRSSRKEQRAKERTTRPVREDKMQVGSYPTGHHHGVQRSPSRPRGRESAHIRHYPGTCWECEQGLYHTSSTPIESSRAIEYPYYPPQPGHDYPPPPPSPRQSSRYPPSAVHDIHVSQSSRPHARTSRSSTYHQSNRPMSYHGMNGMNGMMPGMGPMMYSPSPISRYEHGPPLSSSAYANSPSYGPSPYPPQSPYYAMSDYMGAGAGAPENRRDRSVSGTRDQPRGGRRGSIYDYDDPPTPTYDDGEPLDHVPSRESRPRMSNNSSYDRDEDYYRMPPPPLTMNKKPSPQIIQKKRPEPRKSITTNSVISERRQSKSSFDMSDLDSALDEGYRRTSRETIIPERSRSLRNPRRPTTYREASRPSRIAIENSSSRRRNPTVYYNDGEDIEDKSREAEEYQASRSAKALPVPLTADALSKAKASSRADSDSGSQKSRSNSSRGSDARTQNGSGVGTKPEEDNNIVMTMNGVTMSFTQESVGGKKINVRTGDMGAIELAIEGKKKPQKYLTSHSDYTTSSGRRGEIEDMRRSTRDERRSDRASRRSSRSVYSGRFLE